jgi:hypothetical protein
MRIGLGHLVFLFGLLIAMAAVAAIVWAIGVAFVRWLSWLLFSGQLDLESAWRLGKAGVTFGGVALVPIYWGSRLKTLKASEQLYGDSRQPILYLRPFGADEKSRVMQLDSYEQDLVKVLGKVGPVIAVGNPRSGIGPPGANRVRLQPQGDAWQKDVAKLIQCCRLVVVRGSSKLGAGTRWELAELVARKDPTSVLIGVPRKSSGSERKWRKQYKHFCSVAGPLFPKPLPDDVTDVMFVAFAKDWEPIKLTAKRGWLNDMETRFETALEPHLSRLEIEPYCKRERTGGELDCETSAGGEQPVG